MLDSEARMGDQTILYEYICRKLCSNGLTREEFDRIKKYPIGHNSVEGFVKLNVAIGNLDWRAGTLINVDRTFTLKLTSDEEGKLTKKAESLGLTPQEFATQAVIERLSQK